jgi:hypothetical protein
MKMLCRYTPLFSKLHTYYLLILDFLYNFIICTVLEELYKLHLWLQDCLDYLKKIHTLTHIGFITCNATYL